MPVSLALANRCLPGVVRFGEERDLLRLGIPLRAKGETEQELVRLTHALELRPATRLRADRVFRDLTLEEDFLPLRHANDPGAIALEQSDIPNEKPHAGHPSGDRSQ